MTKEKVNEITLKWIADNLEWAFNDDKSSRDFAQYIDGIMILRSRIVAEIEKEESHKEFEEGFVKAMEGAKK